MSDIKDISNITDYASSRAYAELDSSTKAYYKDLKISSESEINRIVSEVSTLEQNRTLTQLELLLGGLSERKEFAACEPPANYPFFFSGAQLQTNKELQSEVQKILTYANQFASEQLSFTAIALALNTVWEQSNRVSLAAPRFLPKQAKAPPLTAARLKFKTRADLSRKERKERTLGQKWLRLLHSYNSYAFKDLAQLGACKMDQPGPFWIQAAHDRTLGKLKSQEKNLIDLLEKGVSEVKQQIDDTTKRMMQFLHE